jgi:hypothetical protein
MAVTEVTITPDERTKYDSDSGVLSCWVWCIQQFGQPGYRWYFDSNRTFAFRKSNDALLFMMRWQCEKVKSCIC